MMKRYINKELRQFKEELSYLKSDLIRFYNKNIRKSNKLDIWVVLE